MTDKPTKLDSLVDEQKYSLKTIHTCLKKEYQHIARAGISLGSTGLLISSIPMYLAYKFSNHEINLETDGAFSFFGGMALISGAYLLANISLYFLANNSAEGLESEIEDEHKKNMAPKTTPKPTLK